jgi:hypothetical protein
MHWAAAAMARLGWLVTPSTLLYGTGGVTYAGFGDGFNSDTFRAWGCRLGQVWSKSSAPIGACGTLAHNATARCLPPTEPWCARAGAET